MWSCRNDSTEAKQNKPCGATDDVGKQSNQAQARASQPRQVENGGDVSIEQGGRILVVAWRESTHKHDSTLILPPSGHIGLVAFGSLLLLLPTYTSTPSAASAFGSLLLLVLLSVRYYCCCCCCHPLERSLTE